MTYLNYYDRDGNPIDLETFIRLRELGEEYLRVGLDRVGPYEVSTVWLGMDMSFGRSGGPLQFETMVFAVTTGDDDDPERYHHDMECRRYFTLEQAREGHQEMVTLLRATTAEIEDGIPQDAVENREDS